MNSELSNEAVDVIISAIDKYQQNFEVCVKIYFIYLAFIRNL